ncbi:hydantoinase/oxoprolinase N-terminal domain-containing protein [Nocardia carnea]|uniref:hydantoinase/oxoprolinase N-terminal domain-containing protein n=1 Tax=Nocardia carnea TaxID=37328 RepID=UPI002455A19D|nr:hydantoinase/oxoprolinase N-terminal domain-containing protein [Nocardia carnea]
MGDSVTAIATDDGGTVVSRAASAGPTSQALPEILDRICNGRIDRVMVAGLYDFDETRLPDEKVGVLRIAAPSSTSASPLAGWPPRLARQVAGCVAVVSGGHHFDGSSRCPLDVDAVARFASRCRRGGIRAVAIVGTNSQSAPEHEIRAAEIVAEVLGPRAHLVLGSTIPGIGLIERENAAVVEAVLVPDALSRVDALSAALNRRGVDTELHFVTGNGTLVSTTELIAHPLKSHRSLLASALNGVAHEFGVADMAVIDARGSAVQVFTVSDGIPDQGRSGTTIFGVRTALADLRVLTLPGDNDTRILECLERIRLWMGEVPVIRVKGDRVDDLGPELPTVIDSGLGGWEAATGAAAAEVGGISDRVFTFADSTYDEAVRAARAEAVDAAIRAGADPAGVGIARFTDTPLTYVASTSARFSVTARGPLL